MKDSFDYHIHIEHFSSLLLWLTVVCLLGAIVITVPVIIMSRFFLTEKDIVNGKVKRFSIIDFELPYSFSRFKSLIGHISERTKDTVRMSLRVDYYFMPFAYLFLFFGGWYVMQRHHLLELNADNYKILWMPFAAWVMDIAENKIALACLDGLTKPKSWSLFAVSALKWLIVFAFLILLFVIDRH